jgi:hypothetical protein
VLETIMVIIPKKHVEGCPLEAVHQRLEDLHRQWHQAEQAYFDPEAFRVAIQTAILTSRTVSFILQSNKSVVPDFENWYAVWQERFRTDPLMRWMVEARNLIEKQGDLESYSWIRAEIVASYLKGGPILEVPALLADAPLKLLKSIPENELGAHVKKDGFLRIQRKWIENALPDYELLDAVAIAYGNLWQMLSDAHRQMGIDEPAAIDESTGERYDPAAMQGRMPCMIGHGDFRTHDIWLATGIPSKISVIRRELDADVEGVLSSRYELEPHEVWSEANEPKEHLAKLFSTARKMFLKDGYHVTVLALLHKGKPVDLIQLEPEEHGDKYLMMRKIAQQVHKRGADAVIMLGEVWIAPLDVDHRYRRAVDAPNRSEGLQGILVSKSGEPLQYFAEILRTDGTVTLGDTKSPPGGAQFMFAPIYEVWGKAIPEEWTA